MVEKVRCWTGKVPKPHSQDTVPLEGTSNPRYHATVKYGDRFLPCDSKKRCRLEENVKLAQKWTDGSNTIKEGGVIVGPDNLCFKCGLAAEPTVAPDGSTVINPFTNKPVE